MKLIDAFRLGFVLQHYKGEIVYSGTTTTTDELIEIRVHKGFKESETGGAREPIRESVYLPIDTLIDTETMDLILYVRYTDDIALSLSSAGVAPITPDDIKNTRFKR